MFLLVQTYAYMGFCSYLFILFLSFAVHTRTANFLPQHCWRFQYLHVFRNLFRKICPCTWAWIFRLFPTTKRCRGNEVATLESLFNQKVSFCKEVTQTQVFPCNYCKCLTNTFLIQHLRWLHLNTSVALIAPF